MHFLLRHLKNVIKKTLAQNNIVYEINEVMGLPKDFKTHPHYKPSALNNLNAFVPSMLK